jgi:transcriptional regulator with XRE-family HTH domain
MAKPATRKGYEDARVAYELGRRLRDLREAYGLTQRQLAERVGTTQSVIARLEAGGTKPSLSTLERVASALGAVVDIRFEQGAAAG